MRIVIGPREAASQLLALGLPLRERPGLASRFTPPGSVRPSAGAKGQFHVTHSSSSRLPKCFHMHANYLQMS